MKFRASFEFDVNISDLLRIINDVRESDGAEAYTSIGDALEDEILDALCNNDCIDYALDNLLVEELNIKIV